MISKQEFRDAMVIVETYCDQIQNNKQLNAVKKSANEIGCIVKLSAYGKEIQKPHSKTGTVVDWLEWHSDKDGLITVKWDGVAKPDTMHISQVELVLNEKIN